MFDKASLLRRFRTKFEDEQLAAKLKEVLGEDTTLGTDELQTLLLIVMRNATTDSPWPLSNNPDAQVQPDRARAAWPATSTCRSGSSCAPAPPRRPTSRPRPSTSAAASPFLFVDGGVTMYNNPAFLLFLMATVEPYKPALAGRARTRCCSSRSAPARARRPTRPRARRHEPHLQRELDPVGADVRRAERAGLALPRLRRLPPRRPARPRDRRPDRRERPGRPEALHVRPLQRRALADWLGAHGLGHIEPATSSGSTRPSTWRAAGGRPGGRRRRRQHAHFAGFA